MADGVRKDQRAPKNLDLMWAGERGLSGRARLLDISIAGAKLQLGQALVAGDVVSIVCGQLPGLPGRARVRWCRPAPKMPNTFFCGIAFEARAVDNTRWNTAALATL